MLNFGFHCWIHDDRHYKLDEKILDQPIDCAQGVELKSHADVPERIREMIKTREKEDRERGRKKRKATASLSDRQGRSPLDCRGRHIHAGRTWLSLNCR